MKRFLLPSAVALALFAWMPVAARAGLTAGDQLLPRSTMAAGDDGLEAHQYCLPEARVAGQESIRQQVTVWQVTAGTWNGESLKGLSLVLVKSDADNGQSRPATNCYVSHLATAAQRQALISAYVAAQSISPAEITNWRVEPAVIRFELAGQTVVVHLGLVA